MNRYLLRWQSIHQKELGTREHWHLYATFLRGSQVYSWAETKSKSCFQVASAAGTLEFASAFALSADFLAFLYMASLLIDAMWQRAQMVFLKIIVAIWWHVWKSNKVRWNKESCLASHVSAALSAGQWEGTFPKNTLRSPRWAAAPTRNQSFLGKGDFRETECKRSQCCVAKTEGVCLTRIWLVRGLDLLHWELSLGRERWSFSASMGGPTALPQCHLREGSVRCSGQCSVAQPPPLCLKSQFHHLWWEADDHINPQSFPTHLRSLIVAESNWHSLILPRTVSWWPHG